MSDEFLLVCQDCGKRFFTPGERKFYEGRGLLMPKRCKSCREARKRSAMVIKHELEEAEQEQLLSQALSASKYRVSGTEADLPLRSPQTVLYVVGNGFDLLHGVKSSYYNFRDSLGRNNSLRTTLEEYIKVPDLWADFEDSLAHISSSPMFDALDMFLEDFNAYDPDAQAADFFMAVDFSTEPAADITEQLPRRFRMWVESLSLPDTGRPLKGLINGGSRCLCFNYTEFIETLYGLREENICYIHGNRRKKKGHPKEKLIIGHAPGAADGDYEPEPRLPCYKSKWKASVLEAAVDTAARNLTWYDEETTKCSLDIIKAHQSFFDALGNLESIVVIGHSLSPVDWDYFREVIKQSRAPERLKWFFCIHSAADLERLDTFAAAMKIAAGQITVLCI